MPRPMTTPAARTAAADAARALTVQSEALAAQAAAAMFGSIEQAEVAERLKNQAFELWARLET